MVGRDLDGMRRGEVADWMGEDELDEPDSKGDSMEDAAVGILMLLELLLLMVLLVLLLAWLALLDELIVKRRRWLSPRMAKSTIEMEQREQEEAGGELEMPMSAPLFFLRLSSLTRVGRQCEGPLSEHLCAPFSELPLPDLRLCLLE